MLSNIPYKVPIGILNMVQSFEQSNIHFLQKHPKILTHFKTLTTKYSKIFREAIKIYFTMQISHSLKTSKLKFRLLTAQKFESNSVSLSIFGLHMLKQLLKDGALAYYGQTFIKPADLQINPEAKSRPGGQNGLF